MNRRLWPVALVLLAGCDDAVQMPDGRFVECVGFGEERDSTVTYRVDKSNVAVAVVFAETVIVPIWVAMDNLFCPVVEDTTEGRR